MQRYNFWLCCLRALLIILARCLHDPGKLDRCFKYFRHLCARKVLKERQTVSAISTLQSALLNKPNLIGQFS